MAAPRGGHRSLGAPDAVGTSAPDAVGLRVRTPSGFGSGRPRGFGAGRRRASGATSVSFTEQMHGWFSAGATDPVAGRSLGRDRSRRMMFELTITARDIDHFVRDPLHAATAEGYVLADQFGGRLPVERGWFNLFVKDSDSGGTPNRGPARKMLYRLWLRDPGGTPLTFVGHKTISNEAGLDVWTDTTTLFATVLRGTFRRRLPPTRAARMPAPPDRAPGHAPPGNRAGRFRCRSGRGGHAVHPAVGFRPSADHLPGQRDLPLRAPWPPSENCSWASSGTSTADPCETGPGMKRSELAAHSNELGFTPRDAVRWLAPGQLGRTAVRVVLALGLRRFRGQTGA